MEYYKKKSLPFTYGEYEPYISAEIMKLHYEKHYVGYLNKLNDAMSKHPEYNELTIEEILLKIHSLPVSIKKTVQNNGGGVVNHELFWRILNPKYIMEPSVVMKKVFFDSFGSEEGLKEWALKTANDHFGSGWVWLVMDKHKKLKIFSLPNQDSPYLHGEIPILGIDLWEHSYYLQYKNLRADYVEKVWEIIDWEQVEENYHDAIAKMTVF